jgi:general secretion pathway protein J
MSRLRSPRRGFTLIELLVAIGVLTMVSTLIYGAFSGMRLSKEGIQRVSDRHREGRLALARIARELQGAYISKHGPLDTSLTVQTTAFIGKRGTPADRVDFVSFANRRLDRDSADTDQAEIAYFGSRDPARPGVVDLVRRVSTTLDTEPESGGRVEVLATDIDLFNLEYLDPQTGEWVETWDTTQAIGQPDRLPLQVRILLVLNGGRRRGAGQAQDTIELLTKVPLRMQAPLTFATQ